MIDGIYSEIELVKQSRPNSAACGSIYLPKRKVSISLLLKRPRTSLSHQDSLTPKTVLSEKRNMQNKSFAIKTQSRSCKQKRPIFEEFHENLTENEKTNVSTRIDSGLTTAIKLGGYIHTGTLVLKNFYPMMSHSHVIHQNY